MDKPNGLANFAAKAGERVRALWTSFRALPGPAQVASALASGLLVVGVILAVALWPFGSHGGAKAASSSDALASALTPTAPLDTGGYGGYGGGQGGNAGQGGGSSGGSAGGSGNQPAGSTPGSTPASSAPSPLTVTITQVAVSVTGGELSILTAPGASMSASVTYTSAAIPDQGSGLSGVRSADSNGGYTWQWTPVGAVPEQPGEACVSASSGGQTANTCQAFTVTTGALPTLAPIPTPDPLPTITLPVPSVTVTVPSILPTVTVPVPSLTVTVPSVIPTVSLGPPGAVQTVLPTNTVTVPATVPGLSEVRPAPHEEG